MAKVLVTDASRNASLAVIRSLGRKGIQVTAGDSTSFNTGFLSKYCKRGILYPSPETEKTKFVDAMMRLVRDELFDLLIPVRDFTIIPIIEKKEDFEQYVKVAAPRYEVAMKALDKAETIKIAMKNGVPCPRTLLLEDVNDVRKMSKEMRYPVVIKPRMKVTWIGEKAVMLKVTPSNYAYNREDLIKKWTKLVSLLKGVGLQEDFLMVQEFVEGEGYGVEALMQNSEPKAVFMHKRLREYPITGGASTLRVSVKNEELGNLAIKLLKAINWHGVAMVEFKVNKRGKPKLMEINGRFWGSLPLAIASGVDFPYLLYQMMLGEDLSPQSNYEVGVERRWLIPGDLLWLLSSFISGSNKLHVLGEFFKSFKTADDIISITDPLPSFGAIRITMKHFLDVITGRSNIYGERL